ncbi:VEX1 protein, partial [Sakesphorus luctuosus]|nr:VEX1 protein [Sakesphorus luctuosus]
MEKGPFSVEWLARSSRGTGGRESPAVLGESRCARRSLPTGQASRDQEAADPSSRPGHGAEAAGGAVPGRPRTKFSAAQLQELERSFREQRYIGAGEKRRLAAALNLSQSQIKTWFQNRRMKFKRQTQDAR